MNTLVRENGLGQETTTTTTPVASSENTTVATEAEQALLGTYRAYDPQLSIPHVAGTRIVKCLYQLNKKTNTKQGDNSFVRIPTDHLAPSVIVDEMENLLPYVVTFLEGVEDKMIKEEHKSGLSGVYTDALSIAKLIAYMDIQEMGSRLNKEMIEEWFASYVATSLVYLFEEKLNGDTAKAELIVNAYKAKFAALASPKTFHQEADCLALINVIVKAEGDQGEGAFIGKKLVSKLQAMSTKEEELLLAL